MFLQEIGLEESGVARLIKSAYKLLNLQTFLTAGPDECRAWTFHKGWKAPQCAGVIHTDFEKALSAPKSSNMRIIFPTVRNLL